RERLGIATLHSRAQFFKCTELKLLHRTLSASQLLGDFMNAPLVYKTCNDDPALIRGKLLDQPNELGAMFDRGHIDFGARLSRIFGTGNLSGSSLGSIGNRVGRDPQKPGREWYAAPFKT